MDTRASGALLLGVLLLLLSGCSNSLFVARFDRAGTTLRDCDLAFRALDRALHESGGHDAEAARIAGFRYLRVNRLLASYLPNQSRASLIEWFAKAADLDRQARHFELRNLTASARLTVLAQLRLIGVGSIALLEQRLAECRGRLAMHDLRDPLAIARLERVAKVSDNYSVLRRIVGVYPLTAIGVKRGFQRWQRENLASFNAALDPLQRRVLYVPRALSSEAGISFADLPRTPELGLLQIDESQFRSLARAYAPALLLGRNDNSDRPGQLRWQSNQSVEVDTSDPVVHVRLGHTRFGEQQLAQLIYSLWFRERPASGRFDYLAGALDGIIWRVTLDADGAVLVQDTIHPCGCYHLFFPSRRLRRRIDEPGFFDEPISIARWVQGTARRSTVVVAAGNHYIRQLVDGVVTSGFDERVNYRLDARLNYPDAALRSMPLDDGGFRSLYLGSGLVAGTQRAERWFLWPMGIASPGAMRQWGHHATAFVGRRHFDDPHLLDRLFTRHYPLNGVLENE